MDRGKNVITFEVVRDATNITSWVAMPTHQFDNLGLCKVCMVVVPGGVRAADNW